MLIPVLLLVCACAPEPPTVVGRPSVIDGDTLEIGGRRIRLWGVDAPEGRQLCTDAGGAQWRCGTKAANRLDRLIDARPVSCFEEHRDRYERMVARCEVGGEDLGARMVREGLAIRYARYAGQAYRVEEDAAKAEKIGVWAGEFVEPEAWRRDRRGGR